MCIMLQFNINLWPNIYITKMYKSNNQCWWEKDISRSWNSLKRVIPSNNLPAKGFQSLVSQHDSPGFYRVNMISQPNWQTNRKSCFSLFECHSSINIVVTFHIRICEHFHWVNYHYVCNTQQQRGKFGILGVWHPVKVANKGSQESPIRNAIILGSSLESWEGAIHPWYTLEKLEADKSQNSRK